MTVEMTLTALAIVGSLVIAVYVGVELFTQMKAKRLRQERESYTKNMFVAECVQRGFSAEVSGVTWNYLVDWQSGERWFPIKLEDSLYRVFGIAEADLDDAVVEVAKQSKRQRPTTENVAGMPVKTVEDLVAVVDRLPTGSAE